MNPAPNGFKHVTANGLSFDRCPKAWLRDEAKGASEMISDWHWLETHGVMPLGGGKLDQPARFVSAVDVIERELAVMKRAKDAP